MSRSKEWLKSQVHAQVTQIFPPQVSYTLYSTSDPLLYLKFYSKVSLKWKSGRTNLSAGQAGAGPGSAGCCNGQKQGGTAGWSAGTGWGYSNKEPSAKEQSQLHHLQL